MVSWFNYFHQTFCTYSCDDYVKFLKVVCQKVKDVANELQADAAGGDLRYYQFEHQSSF